MFISVLFVIHLLSLCSFAGGQSLRTLSKLIFFIFSFLLSANLSDKSLFPIYNANSFDRAFCCSGSCVLCCCCRAKRNSAVSNVGSIFSLFMSKCACRILFSFLMQADMRANSTAYATTSFSCCLSGTLLRCQQPALCTRMYQQLCR